MSTLPSDWVKRYSTPHLEQYLRADSSTFAEEDKATIRAELHLRALREQHKAASDRHTEAGRALAAAKDAYAQADEEQRAAWLAYLNAERTSA